MLQWMGFRPTGDRSLQILSRLGTWTAACLCSVAATSSLSAAEPAKWKVRPVDWTRERPVIQKAQEIPLEFPADAVETGQSQESKTPKVANPEPLDFSFSNFGWRKSELPMVRPELPSAQRSAASRYFDGAGQTLVASNPSITLTDFLAEEAVAPVLAVDEKLLPPAPDSREATSPAPIPAGDTGVPGMNDDIFRPISQIQPYYTYSPTGKKPYEYLCPQPDSIPENERARCPEFFQLPAGGSLDRHFAMVDYQFFATDLKHKPLYFEDVALERYGQQWPCGIQPFVSIAKFGVQGIGLPYQMAIDPVWRDIYPLGYYRPGDNAPELIPQIPFNLKAAAAAGGVYTGLIFLIP